MKKCLLILTTVLFSNSIHSQVLYTENFDNLSIGNLGTDPSGAIPGQGGWYTVSQYTQANSFFTIVNETGRGKVLDISTGLTDQEVLAAWKTNLHPLMANRLPGNDVLMFELDFFTGPLLPGSGGGFTNITLYSIGDPNSTMNQPQSLFHGSFDKKRGFSDLDPNKKVYVHLPFFNKVSSYELLPHITSTNLIQDYPLSNIVLSVNVSKDLNDPQIYSRNRYDNIKITAINEVPPEVITLSVNEQL